MFYRIFYTSSQQLLEAGRGGFGVVARHKQIPVLVVHAAEAASQFAPLRGAAIHRVIYSYRTETTQSGRWHILSRIEDSGSDYTGRTNYLAQHLVADDNTARHLAAQRITPARVMGEDGAWPGHDKFVGFIEEPAWAPSSGPGTDSYWAGIFDENPDRRFLLAAASAKVTFVYPSEWSDGGSAKYILGLYDEAARCTEPDCRPSYGWGTTFTTYLEPTDKPQDFDWIGLPENSPLLPKLLEAKNRIKVDQHSPVPVRPIWGAPPRKPGESIKTIRQPDAVSARPTGGNIAIGQQPPPPVGGNLRGEPPRPQPIDKPISPWAKWRTPALVTAAAVVAFLALGWVMLFLSPAPPKISFTKTKLEAYTGKPFELRPLIKTEPEGLDVKLSPASLITAGKHQVTASIESTWLRPGTNLTTTIEIPPAKAEITFDPASLKQDYASAKNNGAKPITVPDSDNGAPLEPEVAYKLQGSKEKPQSRESIGRFIPGKKYDVTAKVDGNYVGEASEVLEILPSDTGAVEQPVSTPLAFGNNTATKFFLADKSETLRWLKGKMPSEGKLEVMRLDDDLNKRFEVDRTEGTLVGVDQWQKVFEMEAGCPVKKQNLVIKDQADDTKIKADLDGPLAYIVSSEKGSFIAVELVEGDNKSAFSAFFAGAFVDASKGSPRLCLNLKNSAQVIDLSQVEALGSLQLSISVDPYTATTPLELFAPSGQLVLDGEKKSLERQLQEALSTEQSEQAGPKDYFSRAKGALLGPLKKQVQSKKGGELAKRLLERMDQVSPAAASADNGEVGEQVRVVCDLVISVFKILETAPQNSGSSPDVGNASDLVALSKDRAKEKDGKKKPNTAGDEYLQSISDDSLLTWEELRERILQKDKDAPSAVKRAKKWINGRLGDVSKNDGMRNSDKAKEVKIVLEHINGGLSNVNSVAPEQTDKPKPVSPSENEKKAQAKLGFLKAIGTAQAQSKQGELFLVQQSHNGNSGVAPGENRFLLWPSVSLAPPAGRVPSP